MEGIKKDAQKSDRVKRRAKAGKTVMRIEVEKAHLSQLKTIARRNQRSMAGEVRHLIEERITEDRYRELLEQSA